MGSCWSSASACRKGLTTIKRLSEVLAEHELPARLIVLLQRLHDHFVYLDEQVKGIDKELAGQLADDNLGSCLLSMPCVGPITASLLAVEMGDGQQYGCSRDFAASVGLVATIRRGRTGEFAGDQQAWRQEPATAFGAVRQGLHAASSSSERRPGRLGAPPSDTTAFQCGGLRADQRASPHSLGNFCAPNPIRSRARTAERMILRLMLYHDSPFRFAIAEQQMK